MRMNRLLLVMAILGVIVGTIGFVPGEALADYCSVSCLFWSCSASDPVKRCTCECTGFLNASPKCSCASSSGGGGGKIVPEEDLPF